jgi:hypothetical protein
MQVGPVDVVRAGADRCVDDLPASPSFLTVAVTVLEAE